MKNLQYIRFTRDDKILGLHKDYVNALSKSRANFNENYINVNDYDVSSLCDLSELKKGDTVKGLWNFVQAINTQKLLTEMMVDYLNKVYVHSDESFIELNKKGLKSHHALLKELSLHDIGFDDWIEQYTEPGQALKLELDVVKLKEREEATLARAELERATEHFAGACFSLPAIAGKMGADIYYTVQIPFAQVPQLFKFNEEEVPVELRAQRVLNDKRAKAIADYMEARQHDYTLPALTASVSQTMRFEPVKGFANLGMVQIPIGAVMLLADGQHRGASIQEILTRCPHFKDQSISVVLFYDQGLARAQQMFADINDKMVKPPKALSVLFDRTNTLNRLIVDAIEEAGFKHAVEFEKASPSAKSSKVWSITALKKAAEMVTCLNDKKANGLSDADINLYKLLLVNWFKALIDHTAGGLKEDVMQGTSQSLTDSRINKVNTHAVFLHAVAMASRSICMEFDDYMSDPLIPDLKGPCPVPTFYELNCLSTLPVLKTADVWRERIVNTDGTMNPTANGIKLGAYVVLERLGALIPSPIVEVNNLVFCVE
ncbi:DNA sulfur modification protein DndB [Thalassotalea marina]|uniref:DGQHR domain-containing protein n=1 Tax=Thalassotalea marina TaxID=1673741 RepID=A0A919BSM3_9GAMM|nr:DNA sulfur modification protein DndB [Thalassotalea marina]GHG07236.1 hypothetical protein GCM10017161_41210 [Thalassotalea marina]